MEINLNDQLEKIWTTKKRYILLTGGRGSGKSFGASVFITDKTYEEHFKCLFTRFTMKSAHDSIIPELTSKIELLELQDDFDSTKTDVINKTTSNQIMFRGIKTSSGDQTANLKSLEGVTCFVVDEAEEFLDEEKFDTIDLSVRTVKADNKVIIIMNPSHNNHWVFKKWINSTHKNIEIDGVKIPISTHPDVEHIHTTYLDNIDNLSEDFLKTVQDMKVTRPKYYAHKMLGQWLNQSEGAVIKDIQTFKLSDLTNREATLGYIDVADEGSDYLAYPVGVLSGGRIYLTDVVCNNKNTDITIPLCVNLSDKEKPSYIRCEANNMGAMFARNLAMQYKQGKVIPVTNTTNKHTRILMEVPTINEFFVFLREEDRSPEYQLFMDYVLNYDQDPAMNKKANNPDDPIDALSGLSQFFRGMFPRVFLSKL